MTTQPRGALAAIAERKDELIALLRERADGERTAADADLADVLDTLADHLPALLSAGAEGDAGVTSRNQRAEAWDAIVAVLHEVDPKWIDHPGSGKDSACAAIRKLATHAAPSAGVGPFSAYVGEMETSKGLSLFVMLKRDGDSVFDHVSIRELPTRYRNRAEYEVAELNHLLRGDPEPDILAYPDPIEATPPASAAGESDNHPEKITMSQLPEHDTSKPKNEQGLYRKFEVNRTDGSDAPGGKHHGCEYFVLDTTHDKFAAPALLAYANACESEYPELAADLRKRYMLAAQEGVNMTAQRRRSSDV